MKKILFLFCMIAVLSVHESIAQAYRTEKDVVYNSESEECLLDIYYPVQGKGLKTVVWFHGGGLTGGHREIPAGLKNRNLIVVGVEYRLSPSVKYPVYIEDAAKAIAWCFKNISRYGGDSASIFVAGHSAGGYLTLMTGLDKSYLAKEGIDADRLAGLIPLSPQVITHFTIRKERGIRDIQPIIDEYAPLYHVRKGCPPILLVTGDRELEMLGRYEENAYFRRMMKLVGHRNLTFYELQGYDHGGMMNPALPLLLKFVEKHRCGYFK